MGGEGWGWGKVPDLYDPLRDITPEKQNFLLILVNVSIGPTY